MSLRDNSQNKKASMCLTNCVCYIENNIKKKGDSSSP